MTVKWSCCPWRGWSSGERVGAGWGVWVGESGGHILAIRHLKLVPLFLQVLSTPTAQSTLTIRGRDSEPHPSFPSCSWSCLALKHPALALPSCIFRSLIHHWLVTVILSAVTWVPLNQNCCSPSSHCSPSPSPVDSPPGPSTRAAGPHGCDADFRGPRR